MTLVNVVPRHGLVLDKSDVCLLVFLFGILDPGTRYDGHSDNIRVNLRRPNDNVNAGLC